MSGTIDIRDDKAWMPAGWVFDNVLELAASELQSEDPSLSMNLLEARTDIGSGYLDLRTLNGERFRLLIRAVERVYDYLIKEGRGAFHEPSFYAGFIKHLGELKALLEDDVRARQP